MNFYVDSGGVIIGTDPERVFQGSAMANTVRLIGAFPSSASVLVSYTLPDGTKTLGQLMTFNKELSGVISANSGVALSVWEQKIGVKYVLQDDGSIKAMPDYTLLEQEGKVTVHFTVTQADNNGNPVTQTTAASSFICEKGKSLEMPSEAFDEYESLLNQILGQLSAINEKVDTDHSDFKKDIQSLQDKKVNRSGDTMTGTLEVTYEGNTSVKTFYTSNGAEVINQSDRGKTRYGYGGVTFDNGAVETEFLFPEDEEETATIATQEYVTKEVDNFESQVGQPNGIAPLDETAKVPSEYLPSYVDDVIDFSKQVSGSTWLEDTLATEFGSVVFNAAAAANLEGGTSSPYYRKFLLNTDGKQEGLQIISPEKGKIYVNTSSGDVYRWSGSSLVKISDELKLGETSNTAYPGDKGKANADAIAELQAFLNDVPELNSTATPFLISKKDETGTRRATIVLGEEYTDKTTGKVSYEAGIQSELVDIKAYEIDSTGKKTTKAGVSVKNDGKVRIKGELCDENGNPLNAAIYENLSQLKEILDLAEITEVVETTSTYDTRETADGLTVIPNTVTTVKKVEGSTVRCEQLFDIDSLIYASDLVTNADGKLIFDNSASSNATYIDTKSVTAIKLKPNTTYTSRCKFKATFLNSGGGSGGSMSRALLLQTVSTWESGKRFYIFGDEYSLGELNKEGVIYSTFTTPADLSGFTYLVSRPNGYTITEFSELMLVEGEYTESNFPEYQPYFTGLKSASFSGVESGGRNLFNPDRTEQNLGASANTTPRFFEENKYFVGLSLNNYYYRNNVRNFTVNNGVYSFNSLSETNTSYGVGFNVSLKAGTSYCYSVKTENTSHFVVFYDENGNYIKYTELNPFTVPENCKTAVLLFRVSDGTKVATVENIQVEEGTTATEYTPYISPTTWAFPKTDCGLGTTIDFETKKIVEEYAQYTFNGTESVVSYGAYGSNGYYRYSIRQNSQPMKPGTAQNGICDKYPTDKAAWSAPNNEGIRFGQANSAIYLTLLGDLTVAEVQSLIAGMTMRYPVATPTEMPFTEAQEAAGNTYTPYNGGTEKVVNENAEFGATNLVTQDYDIINKIGG